MSVCRILILEDLETDAELVVRHLNKAGFRFEFHRVQTQDEFERELEVWKPEVILADYCLPSFDGRTAFELARTRDPDVPFIFVSGEIPEDTALDAVRHGATDYVFKDRLTRLAPSLKRALEEVQERRMRRKAEEALRASEERYRRLVDVSPDVVLVHRDTRILFANAIASEKLGVPTDQLIGRSMLDFVEPYYRSLVLNRLKRVEDGETLPMIETINRRADGTPFQVEATSLKIDFQGEPAILSIIRDIGERKRLEREILEISGREQRRIGQDLHDTLGQNLAGAAFLGKALEQKLKREGSPFADDASRVVSLVTQSISQARALSRGLCPIDLVQDGLRIALRELAANTREFFGIACSFEAQGTDPFDETTATHLYHIAQEAVTNAAKHSGATNISITLESGSDHQKLVVRDNGSGFDKEQARGKGGMGLRILDYRARVIGASLEISSQPGIGTTVTSTLY